MEKKYTEEQETFLRSMDFMRLGQAINRGQWQSAAMTVQRMDRNAKAAGLTEFERQFTGIRQCINRRNGFEAKQILAIVVNKRARYLNDMNQDKNIERQML
ncbi:MAG: hypothetical protein U0L12_11065 [Ruminococcus sp.]|nr:hypothetical protein [Ruminococcus sp.]